MSNAKFRYRPISHTDTRSGVIHLPFLKGYVLSYSFQKTATLGLFGGGVHFLSCLLPKDEPPVSPTVVPFYPTHQTTKKPVARVTYSQIHCANGSTQK